LFSSTGSLVQVQQSPLSAVFVGVHRGCSDRGHTRARRRAVPYLKIRYVQRQRLNRAVGRTSLGCDCS
jgi:hypothetical protein